MVSGGKRRRRGQAVVQNQFKQMEDEISEAIENKHTALQQNLTQFKERMSLRRQLAGPDQSRMSTGSDYKGARSIDLTDAKLKSFSPFVALTPLEGSTRKASVSPPSFRN
jgi:hypothetical protein